jgi:hypothetical protein
VLSDGEKYYSEYIQKEEAAFGDEIDKRAYNSETPNDFETCSIIFLMVTSVGCA